MQYIKLTVMEERTTTLADIKTHYDQLITRLENISDMQCDKYFNLLYPKFDKILCHSGLPTKICVGKNIIEIDQPTHLIPKGINPKFIFNESSLNKIAARLSERYSPFVVSLKRSKNTKYGSSYVSSYDSYDATVFVDKNLTGYNVSTLSGALFHGIVKAHVDTMSKIFTFLESNALGIRTALNKSLKNDTECSFADLEICQYKRFYDNKLTIEHNLLWDTSDNNIANIANNISIEFEEWKKTFTSDFSELSKLNVRILGFFKLSWEGLLKKTPVPTFELVCDYCL